mgnify:CR=1 FL=1
MFKIYSIIIDVAPIKKYKKGECIYILNKRIKYYTKEMCKLISILLFSILIVISIIFIKYKPAYVVTFEGENLGYVNNKEDIDSAIDNYINNREGCIADIYIEEKPEYEFKFIDNDIQTNEEQVLLAVQDSSIITYRTFAIKLNGETKDYVESLEQAESIVASLKEQYAKQIEVDLTIEEIYTEETLNIVEVETAMAEIGGVLDVKVQEKKAAEEAARKAAAAKKAKTKTYTSRGTNAARISSEKIDLGISFIEPISGTITSRFGAISSIRTSAHKGLDIAAPKGTKIKAAAGGTVTHASTDKSLGKYVIISHGNGVVTCYAHCSALYVSVGQTVSQGETIAAVGSTGNSTGNHLHLEIRKDEVALNPQHYLYK